MKVMKLLSISLITATLAAIAGSAGATPALRPFRRRVDIYSQPDSNEAAAKLHDEAANESLRAHDHAKELGLHHDAQRHLLAMDENINHMDCHREAMNGGTPRDLSTTKYATRTKKDALKTIAKLKDRVASLHRAAATQHEEAAKVSLVASNLAKQMGWHGLAALHADAAELNRIRMERHIKAEQTGTAYDLSTPKYAEHTEANAHEIISKVKNAKAAGLDQEASRRAEKRGPGASKAAVHKTSARVGCGATSCLRTLLQPFRAKN